MEMRKTKDLVMSEEIGQEVELKQIEFEQIINQDDNKNGLNYIDEKGKIQIKLPEEIEAELQLDDVDRFFYIRTSDKTNEIKILFNNGCINVIQCL